MPRADRTVSLTGRRTANLNLGGQSQPRRKAQAARNGRRLDDPPRDRLHPAATCPGGQCAPRTADRLPAAVAIDAGCKVIVATNRACDGLGGLSRADPRNTDGVTALARG